MRVAVLGCGHVSDLYFVGCRREPLELVACADLDLNRAEQKAAEHSVPRACSPEELLADPDVDLVVNLTPPLAHADVSLAAMRAGKHVWSEKPLAATLEQAREVVRGRRARPACAWAARRDTFLGGGLQTSIKLIDDGWIGEPVAGALCASEIGYEHFHPDVAAFYGPGGGPALDLGPYYVTAVVAMLGPIAHVTGFSRTTFPERTIPTGPRRGQPIPVQVPTHVTGALELASGALVTVLMSWDVASTRLPYLEVYGTAGSLSAGNPDPVRLCAAGAAASARRSCACRRPRRARFRGARFRWPSTATSDAASASPTWRRRIRDERPHRASAELAFHVLEVLLALEAGGRVEIESRCERPPSLDRSAQSSDRRMAGQTTADSFVRSDENRFYCRASALLTQAGVETPREDAQALLAHANDTGEPARELLERRAAARAARLHPRAPGVLRARPARRRACAWSRPRSEPERWSPRRGIYRRARGSMRSGTGSGAVALAVKRDRPDLIVTASDVSSAAVAVATENARRLSLDVAVWQADGLPPGSYDLVLANMPYTDSEQLTQTLPPEEGLFQPGVALWAGTDSLDLIRRLIDQAPSGARMALEHAPHHTREIHELLEGARTVRDARGDERVTVGRAP